MQLLESEKPKTNGKGKSRKLVGYDWKVNSLVSCLFENLLIENKIRNTWIWKLSHFNLLPF